MGLKWGWLAGVVFFLPSIYVRTAIWAQTGPAGVGSSSNNSFWIKADAGTSSTTTGTAISSWNDQSGNSNHVSQSTVAQQPLYVTNVMNGYPAIQFDNNSTAGQNDHMFGADAANLDNTSGMTIFTVTRPQTLGGNAHSIIAKRTNVGVNQAYMLFYYTSDYMWLDVISNDDRFSTSPTSYSINTNYIIDMYYDGTSALASRSRIYTNQTLTTSSSESNSSMPDYNSPLLVGTTHIGDNRPFAGYISEIIIYREALGLSQRIIIDNYLSAKYNIALTQNDVYTMDNAGNGNFDHEVAGIGRESNTDQNNDAKGTGIVRILNPSGLGDNEYMMWGHNNGVQQAINADVPAGVAARFDRVWRVSQLSKTGTVVSVGSIDMCWDLNGLGPVTASHLRLLIDTDGDGIFADETPISGATSLGGGIYQFAGVSTLTNGRRFTLATTNSSLTPLPVELVSFTAQPYGASQVKLNWQTKSEINNDHFLVQHSADGITWQDKFTVKGAGNSSETIEYEQLDETPFLTSNYYRLKQVDFDGNFVYSETRYVHFSARQLIVFPNPAEGVLNMSGFSAGVEFLGIRNALGQLVLSVSTDELSEGETLSFDISALPAGIYFAETNLGAVRFVKN